MNKAYIEIVDGMRIIASHSTEYAGYLYDATKKIKGKLYGWADIYPEISDSNTTLFKHQCRVSFERTRQKLG